MVRKTAAKKIAKTIKPKPKPKVRRAQGQPAPGTRVGTMQNPASKSVTKSKPNTTTAKKTTTAKTSPGSKAVPVPKKGISNIAKVAGLSTIGTGVGIALNKNKGGSFDDAFRKARATGEGTNFTHNGKKYTAVTKDDLKNKGYSSLAAYNKAGGAKKVDSSKAAKKVVGEVKKNKRPVLNAIKKVLLGKDKKFGGDRGLIDFLGKREKKNPGVGIISKPKKKAGGGMMKYKDGGSVSSKKSSSRRGVGAAKRGFGKALR